MTDWNKMPYTQIDVLRHGSCDGGEIFRGSTDVALDEQGWQQMHQSTKDLEWDRIVTSPLKRCRSFAEILGADLGIAVQVDDRWREFDFGIWEGRLREEVWDKHGDDVMQFFTDPLGFTPEGGDSYLAVRERIEQAWDELLMSYREQRVLLITHGGIFRALHAMLESLPGSAFNCLEVPYACLSRWKYYQYEDTGRAILSFHNRQQTGS